MLSNFMWSVNFYPRLSPQFQRLNWPTCNVMKGRRREKPPGFSSQQAGGRRLWYVRKYLRSFQLLVKEEGLHHLWAAADDKVDRGRLGGDPLACSTLIIAFRAAASAEKAHLKEGGRWPSFPKQGISKKSMYFLCFVIHGCGRKRNIGIMVEKGERPCKV